MLTDVLFTELFSRLNGKAVNFINKRSRNISEAEDVVSRSWLCLWRVKDKVQYHPEGLFWMILKRQYKDFVRDDKSRKRAFEPEATILWGTSPEPSPEEWYLAFEAVREYDPIAHGLGKYNNHHCRCEICRKANADYHRPYMQRRRASVTQR